MFLPRQEEKRGVCIAVYSPDQTEILKFKGAKTENTLFGVCTPQSLPEITATQLLHELGFHELGLSPELKRVSVSHELETVSPQLQIQWQIVKFACCIPKQYIPDYEWISVDGLV